MLLSPRPARPRTHDGDTGAQSVSSRGESWSGSYGGTPTPERLCPRAARLPRAPPGPARSHPASRTGCRVPDAPERLRSLRLPPRVWQPWGSAGRAGRGGGGWEAGGLLRTRRPRVLQPPGPLRLLPLPLAVPSLRNVLSYFEEALVFLCLLRAWVGSGGGNCFILSENKPTDRSFQTGVGGPGFWPDREAVRANCV